MQDLSKHFLETVGGQNECVEKQVYGFAEAIGGFNNPVRYVFRAHSYFVAGMTIMYPKVAECFYLPMDTIKRYLQKRCPKIPKRRGQVTKIIVFPIL